jgi:hypothetical protein
MKVYILVGEHIVTEELIEREFTYTFKENHSVHPTLADAKSAYNVAKAVGEWKYDDYDIEEHDL